MPDNNANGWAEYKMLVIQQLEHLNTKVDEFGREFARLDKDLALLKQRVALWSAVGASLATAAIQILLRYIK